MKVTLRQIAEKTGVSVNTVSLALRGMSNISDETREKVVRAARELGSVSYTHLDVYKRQPLFI